MKEKVTLNVIEQKRLLVLNEILAGRITSQEAIFEEQPDGLGPRSYLRRLLNVLDILLA